MTFSIAARCSRTGMFGIAITTSSIGVGSRCSWAQAGVGAVLTQNFTDPSLGARGLGLLAEGLSAVQVINRLVSENRYPAYRQIAVIDRNGHTSHYSGEKTLGTHAAAMGTNCVAVGNLLASAEVPREMIRSFTNYSDLHVADRLLLALEKGLEAGGEVNPVKSAGLLVVHEHPWPLIDLRVDWEESPLRTLRNLWKKYEPQMNTFLLWALSPDKASPEEGGLI